VVWAVQPQSFSVLSKFAQGFKFYRFTRLMLEILPVVRFETTVPTTSDAGQWAAAYLPEELVATPTSLSPGNLRTLPDCVNGMCQVVNSNVSNDSSLSGGWPGTLMIAGDTRSRHLRVSPRTLSEGLSKTYYCQGTTGPGVTQGFFAFALGDSAGGNTVKPAMLIHWTVRFEEPEDSSTLGVPRLFAGVRSGLGQVPGDEIKSENDWETAAGCLSPRTLADVERAAGERALSSAISRLQAKLYGLQTTSAFASACPLPVTGRTSGK